MRSTVFWASFVLVCSPSFLFPFLVAPLICAACRGSVTLAPPSAAVAIASRQLQDDACMITTSGSVLCWPDFLGYRVFPGARSQLVLANNALVGVDSQGAWRCDMFAALKSAECHPRSFITAARLGACYFSSCCAILPGGALTCWGLPVANPPSSSLAIAVSVSQCGMCSLAPTGQPICTSFPGVSGCAAFPTVTGSFREIVVSASPNTFVCAVGTNSIVQCFGPSAIAGYPSTPAFSLALGLAHGCAISNATKAAVCWVRIENAFACADSFV